MTRKLISLIKDQRTARLFASYIPGGECIGPQILIKKTNPDLKTQPNTVTDERTADPPVLPSAGFQACRFFWHVISNRWGLSKPEQDYSRSRFCCLFVINRLRGALFPQAILLPVNHHLYMLRKGGLIQYQDTNILYTIYTSAKKAKSGIFFRIIINCIIAYISLCIINHIH